jgi:hypothetical protein
MMVLQKVFEEGLTSPYRARIWNGMMELRNGIISDPLTVRRFDDRYEPVLKTLDKARESAREIHALVADHRKALKAQGAVVVGPNDQITVNIAVNPTLDRRFDSFTVFAHRAIKLTQDVLKDVAGLNIGFLFQSAQKFTCGVNAIRTFHPDLAKYLEMARQTLTEPLVQLRNEIEHKGWTMPGIQYRVHNGILELGEVNIRDMPFTAYVTHVLNRAIRFVEDLTAYSLKTLMIGPRAIIELPEVQRASANPKRFALAMEDDYRTWHLIWETDSTDFVWVGQ